MANRSLIARMPVSGVRTSWANAASAVSTMPGMAAAAVRLRALRAATRFFGGRRFGDRVVRLERDFGAMIPLSPARWHHATAGLPESRRRTVTPDDRPVAN